MGIIRFEWDPVKARTNLRKPGISFDDAMQVFDDPFALIETDGAAEAASYVGGPWDGWPSIGGVWPCWWWRIPSDMPARMR